MQILYGYAYFYIKYGLRPYDFEDLTCGKRLRTSCSQPLLVDAGPLHHCIPKSQIHKIPKSIIIIEYSRQQIMLLLCRSYTKDTRHATQNISLLFSGNFLPRYTFLHRNGVNSHELSSPKEIGILLDSRRKHQNVYNLRLK